MYLFVALIVEAHLYYFGIAHGGKGSCTPRKSFVIAMIARKSFGESHS